MTLLNASAHLETAAREVLASAAWRPCFAAGAAAAAGAGADERPRARGSACWP